MFNSRPLIAGLATLLFAGQAVAQDAAEEPDLGSIDTIVVTITKRAVSIQDVPATISAFDAEAIGEANIESASDLISLIPNAQIKGDNGSITIRGISSTFTGASAVAIHQNGVFMDDFVGTFYDLETIEVARGVTGTVYGRNATAGAINYRWKKPHDEWEAFGDVTLGNYDLYQFRGGLNVPFLGVGNDRILGRFVVQRTVRDEYLDLVDQPQSKGGDDFWSVRGTITFNLSEDVSINVRGFYGDSDGRGAFAKQLTEPDGSYLVGTFPQFGNITFDPGTGYEKFLEEVFAFPSPVAIPISLHALGFATQREGAIDFLKNGFPGLGPIPPIDPIMPFANFGQPYPVFGQQQIGASNLNRREPEQIVRGADGELDWVLDGVPLLGDIRLNLLGGWNRRNEVQVAETDGTPFAVIDSISDIKIDRYTGEARLTSEYEDSFNWIAGIFYFRERNLNLRSTATPFVFAMADTFQESKSLAWFLNAEIRPLEYLFEDPTFDLRLFGGFRHNRDKSGSIARLPDDVTFHENTYEVGINFWPFGDDHMFYVKFAKGYKPGIAEQVTQTDPLSGLTTIELNAVSPEILRAWEAGWRSTWWDGRLQLNLTGFLYDYANLQVPQIVNSQVQTANAASASLSGIELDFILQPIPEWTIRFAGGWLDATFDQFCNDDEIDYASATLNDPACPIRDSDTTTPGTQIGPTQRDRDLAGNRLEDSPEFSLSLVSSYKFDLGELGTLTPVIEFTWTDDYFRSAFNRPVFDTVESHTRSDVRLLWESASARYTVELFVENIEDEIVFARTIAVEVPASISAFGLLPPRVYGLRLGYHWGGPEN